MSTVGIDIKYALRNLIKRTSFTLTAVVTLALGIGALSSIFSVISETFTESLFGSIGH